MTGRMLSETLGRWNFWLLFVGMNLAFMPMHFVGLRGMPRRVYTYPAGMGWDAMNLVETVGAYVTALGVLVFVANVLWSLRAGRVAGANPWGAPTLEWATSSPPKEYNFVTIPSVTGRDPLWEAHDPVTGRAFEVDDTPPDPSRAEPWRDVSVQARHELGLAPTEAELPAWRVLALEKETLGSTLLDGDPQGVLRMPEDTLAPLVLALALTGLFAALLAKAPLWTAAAALATLGTVGWWLWPSPADEPKRRRPA
jgi:hypothetical protein